MRLMKQIFIFLLVLSLSGCAYFTKPSFIQNRDKTYLNARSTQPVRIPPGVTPAPFTATYPIPDHEYPESTKYPSIVPPGLNS